MLTKKQMTEEDIKLQFITPAITATWKLSQITMETKITDGKINLKGNLVVRERPKKADYVLYLNDSKPIAIVEAKDNNHTVSYGIQQAITYARISPIMVAFIIKTWSLALVKMVCVRFLALQTPIPQPLQQKKKHKRAEIPRLDFVLKF